MGCLPVSLRRRTNPGMCLHPSAPTQLRRRLSANCPRFGRTRHILTATLESLLLSSTLLNQYPPPTSSDNNGEKQYHFRCFIAFLRESAQSRSLSSGCKNASSIAQGRSSEGARGEDVHVVRGTGAHGAREGDIGDTTMGVRAASLLWLVA